MRREGRRVTSDIHRAPRSQTEDLSPQRARHRPAAESQLGHLTETAATSHSRPGVSPRSSEGGQACVLADALVARAQSDSVTPWTVAHQASSIHGTLQVRILEWVAMPFYRGIFLTQG